MTDIRCGLCLVSFSRKSALLRHQRKFHESFRKSESAAAEKRQTHVFYSEDDFIFWKYNLEKSTCSKFVQSSCAKRDICGTEVKYLRCHRSGTFKVLEVRKRRLKSKGSVKIGTRCPAKMKVVKVSMFGGVEVTVTFWPEHQGHSFDPETLTLTAPEKKALASRLSKGVSKRTILSELESRFCRTERMSLTTRKDLLNISASLRLRNVSLMDKKDAASVEATVRRLRSHDDGEDPVLLYKAQGVRQGEDEEFRTAFRDEDFVLGVMNDVQLTLLSQYGNGIVHVDSTHGTNSYNVQLTTLMVNDGNEEGLPVAVLFSSRQTTQVMEAFFGKIKERLAEVNCTLAPKVFMSDDAPAFHKGWRNTFGPTPNRLICAAHVEKTFKSILLRKIADESDRDRVDEELTSLRREPDQEAFRTLLESFVAGCSSEKNTEDFGKHFSLRYARRPEQWAHCYRHWPDMNFEKWHREIKDDGGEDAAMKGLDKALHVVSSAVRGRLASRVVNIHGPRLTARTEGLRRRHERSLELSSNEIFEVTEGVVWVIPPGKALETSFETYQVKKRSDNCEDNCDMRCHACAACVHQYTCTCIDSTVRMQMCEHVHKICTLFPPRRAPPKGRADGQGEEEEEEETSSWLMVIETDVRNEPEDDVTSEESHVPDCALTHARKNRCVAMLQTAISLLHQTTFPPDQYAAAATSKCLDAVEKSAQEILSELEGYVGISNDTLRK